MSTPVRLPVTQVAGLGASWSCPAITKHSQHYALLKAAAASSAASTVGFKMAHVAATEHLVSKVHRVHINVLAGFRPTPIPVGILATAQRAHLATLKVGPFAQVAPGFKVAALGGLGRQWAERLERSRLPNWPRSLDVEQWEVASNILVEEGIPLAWVVPLDLVIEVIDASDRESRLALLADHEDDIVDLCAKTIAAVDDELLPGLRSEAEEALAAFRCGHRRSAMAHSVNLIDSAMSDVLRMGNKRVRRDLAVELGNVPMLYARAFAALTPLVPFMESWWPDSGVPVPVPLSRHVVVHQLRSARPEWQLVSIMLLASVLRGLQDWVEWDCAQLDLSELKPAS